MSEKNCIKCNQIKLLSEFCKVAVNKDGRCNTCKVCRGKLHKEYSRTKKGIASTILSNQRYNSKKRGHVSPEYTKAVFLTWLFTQPEFDRLYELWVSSGYLTSEKPSCDRLDDYKPYTLDNIRIVTWRENNNKGKLDRKTGNNNKRSKSVIQMDADGSFISRYHSMRHAERVTGINQAYISLCCTGKKGAAGGFIWKYA